ncbi:MAG TPA: transcription antitermination factor NusB [Acidimicrobiales bacterium]|nr:transcription antitermination factor NusB [Acidimicrobiales bacterium]
MSLADERRAARERALGLLYEAETKGRTGAEVLAELPIPPEPLAEELVRAVDAHRAEIDALLERFAQGWPLHRMAALDRAALRMGAAELIARPQVPTGVVLAEAVELASRFGTDGSGRFVNGLLAAVAREVRGDVRPAPAELHADDDADRAPLEPQVDAFIVDLDGVIRHWDESYYPAAEERLGLPPGTFVEVALDPERLRRATDGRLRFEDWCREIGEELAARHGVDADAASDAWADSTWSIDLDVLDVVDAVREVVPVVLLSNASTRLIHDLDRSDVLECFDAVVGSADIRVAKPAPGAYLAAADAAGVPPERCLFVDDTMENVEGARAVGMRAERFTGLDDLRALLRSQGLLR